MDCQPHFRWTASSLDPSESQFKKERTEFTHRTGIASQGRALKQKALTFWGLAEAWSWVSLFKAHPLDLLLADPVCIPLGKMSRLSVTRFFTCKNKDDYNNDIINFVKTK